MPTPDPPTRPPEEPGDGPAVRCEACQAALQSAGRRSVSFLLVDHLTVPVIGCDEHLDQFSAVCGLSTVEPAELLGHLPAGGIRCPGCRLAGHAPRHPVVRIDGGAVAPLACPDHQSALAARFRTGLQVRQHLTATPQG